MRRNRAEYNCWWNLIDRCTNVKNKQYPDYGGRGINVCEEWLNSFPAFIKHVGKKPSDKHSLDRIDNDGNYEPGNVRWTTRSVQRVNTRNNRNCSSVYRGVSWDSSVNKWWAEITRNKVTYRLGRFSEELEAAKAFERKRAELDGTDYRSPLPRGADTETISTDSSQ